MTKYPQPEIVNCRLFRWLNQSYSDLAGNPRVNWTALARVLSAKGYVSSTGVPLTGPSVNEMWKNVLTYRADKKTYVSARRRMRSTESHIHFGWVYALTGIGLRCDLIKVGHTRRNRPHLRALTIIRDNDVNREKFGVPEDKPILQRSFWIASSAAPRLDETKAHKLLSDSLASEPFYPKELFKAEIEDIVHALRVATGSEPKKYVIGHG